MTNFEKIQSEIKDITVEEFVETFFDGYDEYCFSKNGEFCVSGGCRICALEWLKGRAKE